MTTTPESDAWIAFKDQKPPAGYGHIWLFAFPTHTPQGTRCLWDMSIGSPPDSWEFWQPAKVPAPPKPIPTQQQLDDEEYERRYGSDGAYDGPEYTSWSARRHGWREALIYEREAVASLLAQCVMEGVFIGGLGHRIHNEAVFKQLAQRVALWRE